MAYLPLVLLILVALFSSATVLSVIIAIRSSREHHNTIFPMVREVEGIKARQARVAMAVFLVLSAITIGGWVATQQNLAHILRTPPTTEQASLSRLLVATVEAVNSDTANSESMNVEVTKPLIIDNNHNSREISTNTPKLESSVNVSLVVLATDTPIPSATPTSEPTTTSTPIPTATPTPTPSLTSTPTPASTVTPTVPPTPTRTATPKPTEPEPLVGPRTVKLETPETPETPETIEATPTSPIPVEDDPLIVVPTGISIGPITFAADITDHYEAVDPRGVFEAQTERVYAVFPYRGMKNGLPLSVIWYYQDQEFLRDEYEWRWGNTARFYIFVKRPAAGNYKIEIKIGPETMAMGNFEVRP